jgi:pre-mRNA-splicing factor 18
MGGLSGGAAPEDPTLRLEHGALGEPSAASSLPPAKRRRLEDDEADSSAAPATSARRVLESSPVLGGAHEVVAGAGSAAGAAETTAAEASAALDVGRDGCDDEDARSTGSKQSKDRSGARTKAADATRYRPVPGNAHANQHKYAYKWIRGMLNEWEDELATRSAAEAMSARGREEASLWQQSTQYVRPLLRRLRSKSVPADILKLVVEIVGHCEDREYAVAGDAYVRLAIGNAAWPIGVTAVGLHERAAREKVYEGRQAHVMHNEESRKYVTILKRLISLAQRKWPAEPSKSVYS